MKDETEEILKIPETLWRYFDVDEETADSALDTRNALIHQARSVKQFAYAPYSRFHVGSALMMDGTIFTGTNVENASYGGTLCAERTAIASAVATGLRKLEIIAISTDAPAGSPIDQRAPCGLCRQVMSEFATPDTIVLLDAGESPDGSFSGEVIRFETLFPWRFRLGE
jgi:cytidine deaminase